MSPPLTDHVISECMDLDSAGALSSRTQKSPSFERLADGRLLLCSAKSARIRRFRTAVEYTGCSASRLMVVLVKAVPGPEKTRRHPRITLKSWLSELGAWGLVMQSVDGYRDRGCRLFAAGRSMYRAVARVAKVPLEQYPERGKTTKLTSAGRRSS